MRKKMSALWARWGFYVSLALALSLIGGAAVWFRNQPARTVQTAMASPTPAAVLSAARAEPTETFTLFPPLDGVRLASHSPDGALYDGTLKAYFTHIGLDIAGPAGAQVCAAADGRVSALRCSAEYGYTLEIDHGEGRTTRYGGLLPSSPVALGDWVKAGQAIGGLGEYPCRETFLGPHLHFELLVDGESRDPETCL